MAASITSSDRAVSLLLLRLNSWLAECIWRSPYHPHGISCRLLPSSPRGFHGLAENTAVRYVDASNMTIVVIYILSVFEHDKRMNTKLRGLLYTEAKNLPKRVAYSLSAMINMDSIDTSIGVK